MTRGLGNRRKKSFMFVKMFLTAFCLVLEPWTSLLYRSKKTNKTRFLDSERHQVKTRTKLCFLLILYFSREVIYIYARDYAVSIKL